MEDRLEINGVWYVKEENVEALKQEPEVDFFDHEIVQTRELIIETDEFIMKGTVLEDDHDFGTELSMPSIDIQYKNGDERFEFWDNDSFIIGIANESKDWLEEISDESEKVKAAAIMIAKRMLELKWL